MSKFNALKVIDSVMMIEAELNCHWPQHLPNQPFMGALRVVIVIFGMC